MSWLGDLDGSALRRTKAGTNDYLVGTAIFDIQRIVFV